MDSYRIETISDGGEPEPKTAEHSRSGLLRFILDVLETLVLSVLLFAGINTLTARIRVDGPSMQPTLYTGEFVIVNKLAYRFGAPKTGDVVVFHYPRDPEQEYIKRVIGAPGDTVKIQSGQVYVNGALLTEPYIAAKAAYPDQEWTVPADSLFVLGDNRNNSSDSHNWGFVQMNYLIGKAMFIYWPPKQWGIITLPSTANAAP